MKVREKTPDKILVNVEFLKSAISEDKVQRETEREYENSKNVLLALGGGLTSCLLTLIPSWENWSINLKVTIVIFSIVYLLFSLWFLTKLIQSRNKLKGINKTNLEEYVIDEAKKKIRYTALLIVCHQKARTGEVKFMTEKQGNYLIHCDMNPYKDVNAQKDNIINYIVASYNVQKNQIVDVVPLSGEPFFSIKPIHGETTQNGFIFFQIKMKKKAKQGLSSHKDISWKTIQEMEGMSELMGRNQDIVMQLSENKTKITDSFEDYHGPMHVIWNITKDCPYNCAICATRDDERKELSTEDKLKVLNNIFSAKESISTLDFAGGDPMYKSEIRTVIMQAINSLGEEHVSVTTTGKGIQAMDNASEEEISKLLKRCEITIDASHENLAQLSQKSVFSRKTPEYCSNNYEQIQSTSDSLEYLMINIPLLDDDLEDNELDNLISKLLRLKQNYSEIEIEAQIIRLMPVGAFIYNNIHDDYKKYQPINIAKKIRSRVEEIGIRCRFHCSLRVLPEIGECDGRCNMLDKKIGIDCSGNVFACTWGAYLHLPDNCDISQNPFYLGNLVSSSLKSIINGQGGKTAAYKRISRDINNHAIKPYCEVVSFFFNNSVDENNDPLSKKNIL